MSVQPENRYSISEVSDMLRVPASRLRQWEKRFPLLNPARNRANQRYYTEADVEIVRRIKQLLQHEKLTTKGAVRRLTDEIYSVGRPQTRSEMVDLLDKMEHELRSMLDMLDRDLHE